MSRHFIIIKGKIKAGRAQGKKIGFPTINVAVPRFIKKADWGIYFSLVKIADKFYPGVTHLGPPKTFSLRAATCETHLFTVSGDFYGQTVEKRLLFKFREVTKFNKLGHLKKQIKKDLKAAKRYFGV
jgi:riboflavin kinase/FMN adenylyltransferase